MVARLALLVEGLRLSDHSCLATWSLSAEIPMLGIVPLPMPVPSKNQVDKAGKFLRDLDLAQDAALVDEGRELEARQVVQTFRQAHAYPILRIRIGLEGFCNTTKVAGAVTQRHKRVSGSSESCANAGWWWRLGALPVGGHRWLSRCLRDAEGFGHAGCAHSQAVEIGLCPRSKGLRQFAEADGLPSTAHHREA